MADGPTKCGNCPMWEKGSLANIGPTSVTYGDCLQFAAMGTPNSERPHNGEPIKGCTGGDPNAISRMSPTHRKKLKELMEKNGKGK